MARSIPTPVLSLLQTKTGTEPLFLIAIKIGVSVIWFSSKRIVAHPEALPCIVSMGECSSERRHDSAGSTGSLSVTLSDFDGQLKSLHDNILLDRRPSRVYVYFEDSPLEGGTCILSGHTAGPFEWTEGERNLSFTIDAAMQGKEVGFAPTDEFDDLAPEAVGVPWPMIFGQPAHVPTVRVRKATEGRLITPIRLDSFLYISPPADPAGIVMDEKCTVASMLGTARDFDKIHVEGGDRFPQNVEVKIAIEKVVFNGKFNGTTFNVTEANLPYYTNVKLKPDVDRANYDRYFGADIDDPTFKGNLTGFHVYLKPPPGKDYRLYNFVTKQEKNHVTWKHAYRVATGTSLSVLKAMDAAETIERAYYCLPNGLRSEWADRVELLFELEKANATKAGLIGAPFGLGVLRAAGIIKMITEMVRESNDARWSQPAGTRVVLYGADDPDVYIASCVPLTSIDAVYGRKTTRYPDGTSIKTYAPIPQHMYTVALNSGYNTGDHVQIYASGLLFDQPLRDYAEEGWDDAVYVTATSSVGPNPVDIIRYLIDRYGDGVVLDNTDAEATVLTDDHADFAVLQRKNVFELCRDIAWQCRCALRLDGEKADLKYLPDTTGTTLTVNQSGILNDSVKVGTTDVNSITTKLIGKWRPDYRALHQTDAAYNARTNELNKRIRDIISSDNGEDKAKVYVYRENIDRFGEKTEERDVFIFNNVESVSKCIDFWGHRMANVWRTIAFETALLGIIVQAFDHVAFSFGGYSLGGYDNLKGEVERASLNPAEKKVTLSMRLEVKAGE